MSSKILLIPATPLFHKHSSLVTMQKSHRCTQSVQCASSKHPLTPWMSLSVHRHPPNGCLQKLPSASSPVSFQQLLQVKFQTPKVTTQVGDRQSTSLEADRTLSDMHTSSSSESNSSPESDLDPTSKSRLMENDTSTSQPNDLTSSTMLQTALAITSLLPTLQAQDLSSDPNHIICKSLSIAYPQPKPDIDKMVPAINTQKEASIQLAAAGMHKKVIHAEHCLTLYAAREHTILGQLYQELTDQAEKQATAADLRMNNVCHSIQKQGFELMPASPSPHSAEPPLSPTKKWKLP